MNSNIGGQAENEKTCIWFVTVKGVGKWRQDSYTAKKVRFLSQHPSK